jgi:transposase
MQVVYERCCGLDVHKDTVAACIAITEGGRVRREKRVFGTTTKALLELSDWLAAHSVTHVGMESTGVYFALSSALFGRVQVPLALG